MRVKVAAACVALLVVALGSAPLDPAAAAPAVSVCDSPTSTPPPGGARPDRHRRAGPAPGGGAFTGKMVLLADGTVCVAADATFEPQKLKSPAGDLIVLGSADLPSLTSESGFDLVVDGPPRSATSPWTSRAR